MLIPVINYDDKTSSLFDLRLLCLGFVFFMHFPRIHRVDRWHPKMLLQGEAWIVRLVMSDIEYFHPALLRRGFIT